jgi:ATP-binding cassette subfamily B protein
LLRRPDVVIFDEATSSLDSLTEEEVSQTIRRVTANRRAIAILIAHRLSTVIYADRIYILERGRIIDQGRHEDLLARGGLYASLWRQQTGATAASTETTPMPNFSVPRGTSAG